MERKNKSNNKKEQPMFFQIVNAFFTNRDFIYNMTTETAKQNLFMVLRRLAIKYPEQANVFNYSKVNALDTMKFWVDYLYGGSNNSWIYTAGGAKLKEKKKLDISKEDIGMYKDRYDLSNRDFEDYMKFFPEYITSEVKNYADLFK